MSRGASLLCALVAVSLQAQSVDVVSEFHRVDPFGAVIAADRAIAYREILSPAVVRNGFASFHIVVTVPPPDTYLLYVATNPLNACRVNLYKEHFARTSRGWIPDRLSEVTQLPDFGSMPDPDDHIAGQNTRVYLLDLWIPPNADVARFRLEVQLKMAHWMVRPLEVRVLPARIPDIAAGNGAPALPPIEEGADSPALQVGREYQARGRLLAGPQPATVRGIIRRNAVQDMTLADNPNDVARRVLDLMAENLRLVPRVFGAEWYLRLRDFLYNR